MKDLDKTQVYDLRGITEEQAKELLDWLNGIERGWDEFGYMHLMEDLSLEYLYPEWVLGAREPTTHISTLFEQSYEQQLQEAKKQLDHYKKEVERLENESKPKVGDVAKAWNCNEKYFVVGVITFIDNTGFPYCICNREWFCNVKKLTEQEVIDLLFKKQ